MSRTQVLLLAFVLICSFAMGSASGLLFYPRIFGNPTDDSGHSHGAASTDDAHPPDHLEISEQAVDNLDLRLGKVVLSEYWKSRAVPGEIIEIPGRSDISISAPVTGIVEQVFVTSGQAAKINDILFTLRIIDDELTKSQSDLLANLSKQSVTRSEIDRLKPLADTGTVSGNRKRELEYELRQLESLENTLLQKLRAHGLPDSAIEQIIQNRSLATALSVRLPDLSKSTTLLTSQTETNDLSHEEGYSVGEIKVHPGKSVQRNEDLCRLAFHQQLYIQGRAFQTDLKVLTKIAEQDWPITVQYDYDETDAENSNAQHDLQLLYVDNHVDHATQTFHFYLPLENEIALTSAKGKGQTFHQWRHKPGQHVYLYLPEEQWKDQIVVPLGALVMDGPETYVYKKLKGIFHGHSHADDEIDEQQAHAHYVRFQPIPVRLLHRDDRNAVIANDGQIDLASQIARNNAYKLHLAFTIQSSSGGGHHGHEH